MEKSQEFLRGEALGRVDTSYDQLLTASVACSEAFTEDERAHISTALDILRDLRDVLEGSDGD